MNPGIKRLLLLAFLLFSLAGFSQEKSVKSNPAINNDVFHDSLSRFVRFDHTDSGINYYSVMLSMFNSYNKRGSFYEVAKSNSIYMVDKFDIRNDSALFMTDR